MAEMPLEEIKASIARLCQERRFAEAEADCRAAAVRFTSDASVMMDLAAVLAVQGKFDEALLWHDSSVAAAPNNAVAHLNRGRTLQACNRLADAAGSFAQALRLSPDHPDALSALGRCWYGLHRLDDAEKCFRRVVELSPQRANEWAWLGQVVGDRGDHHRALAHIRRAVELDPASADHRFAYAMALLLHGDLQNGFREYEARLGTSWFARPSLPAALWDGSPLNGRTIILQTESGVGDALQFIRYAPLVAQRGGKVIAGSFAPIKDLIATVPGVSAVLAAGDPLPRLDCWISLLSLPRIFQTELSTIPAQVPYLHPDPQRVMKWKERLSPLGGRRIGLVWAGNPQHPRDWLRSMRLEQFAPLASVSGVTFFSLQKGPAAEQAKSPPAGMNLIDVANDLHDFSDTAALLMNLDLLISVDTAVVHLAGALARPVWTLIAAGPDWRWLLDRTDSPWYPTMRLFRQRKVNQWDDVMEQVAHALAAKD